MPSRRQRRQPRNSFPGAPRAFISLYNEFKSVMTQRVVVKRILPIPRLEGEAATGPVTDYLYEPGPEQIFEDLLPRHVQIEIFRALLESNAAFFAAR